jgi:transitional endoplasmic reticulum ATPase
MKGYLGRFNYLLCIPLPDEQSRLAILKASLSKLPVAQDVDLNYLVTKTVKYTGADLVRICQRVGQLAAREFIEKERQHLHRTTMNSTESQEIRLDHFENLLKIFQRSVTDDQLKRFETNRNQLHSIKHF